MRKSCDALLLGELRPGLTWSRWASMSYFAAHRCGCRPERVATSTIPLLHTLRGGETSATPLPPVVQVAHRPAHQPRRPTRRRGTGLALSGSGELPSPVGGADGSLVSQRWQQRELRGQGKAVSAEELCADCPELLEDVRRRVQALAAMEQIQAMAATPTHTAAANPTVARPPHRSSARRFVTDYSRQVRGQRPSTVQVELRPRRRKRRTRSAGSATIACCSCSARAAWGRSTSPKILSSNDWSPSR